MGGLKSINLIVAFGLELSLLVIFATWGVAVSETTAQKVILGASLPILLAVLWGKFLAPASMTRLIEPWLLIVKLMIFGLAAMALLSMGKLSLALWFGIISLINLGLLYLWRQ